MRLIKRTPIRFLEGDEVDSEEVEKEFDNVFKQVNQMLAEKPSTKLEFYVAETSGGSVTKKLNIEINEYGIVTKLSLT